MSPHQQPKSLIERAFGLVDSDLEREMRCSGVLLEQAENTLAGKFLANFPPSCARGQYPNTVTARRRSNPAFGFVVPVCLGLAAQ
jgi:hypothetical protein